MVIATTKEFLQSSMVYPTCLIDFTKSSRGAIVPSTKVQGKFIFKIASPIDARSLMEQ